VCAGGANRWLLAVVNASEAVRTKITEKHDVTYEEVGGLLMNLVSAEVEIRSRHPRTVTMRCGIRQGGGSRHIVVTVGPPSGRSNVPQTAKPTDSYLRRFAGFVDSR
jgi:hypothetical protein